MIITHIKVKVRRQVAANGEPGQKVALVTDSQSNLRALLNPSIRDDVDTEVFSALRAAAERLGPTGVLAMRFVRGHSGVAGNEIADQLAGIANKELPPVLGVPATSRQFRTEAARVLRLERKEKIRAAARKGSKTARTLLETGGSGKNLLGRVACSRPDEARYFAYRLGVLVSDYTGKDLPCAVCGAPEATSKHLLVCPGLADAAARHGVEGHEGEVPAASKVIPFLREAVVD